MSEVKGWNYSELFEALVQGKLPSGFELANRYEIRELLGKGGVGLVYRVYDRKLGEEIVIKILNPTLASDRDTVERFRREIKICRKIVHPNVIRIYDIDEIHGTPFITMELVEGQNLKSLIRSRGKLAEVESRVILRGIVKGLAAAHAQEVIHRDLKSHNVMVDDEANVKILDFGMARLHGMEHLTRIGDVLGSPPYMSPEQAQGLELDHRTDLYSLGIILFEMCTGQLPFVGQNPIETVMMHLEREPARPRSIVPELSELMERVILTCLQKRPDDRFQEAEEILDLLSPSAAPAPSVAAPAPPPVPTPPPVQQHTWWKLSPVENPLVPTFAACLAGAIAASEQERLPPELLDMLELAASLKNQSLPLTFRTSVETRGGPGEELLPLVLGLRYYTNRVKLRSALRELFAAQARENLLVGTLVGEVIAVLARQKSQDAAQSWTLQEFAPQLRERLDKAFFSEAWLQPALSALETPLGDGISTRAFEETYLARPTLAGLHVALSGHPAGEAGFERIVSVLEVRERPQETWRRVAAAFAGALWAFWNSFDAIPCARLEAQSSSALAYDLGASLAAAAVVLETEKPAAP